MDVRMFAMASSLWHSLRMVVVNTRMTFRNQQHNNKESIYLQYIRDFFCQNDLFGNFILERKIFFFSSLQLIYGSASNIIIVQKAYTHLQKH